MLSSLMKDSLVYGIANAIQKMIPFFIIPIVTGYLGQDALKIYDVSFVYAYLFSWLIISGQDAAGAILYFDEKKTQFNKKQVVAYALLIQLVVLAFFLCLFFFFSGSWGTVLFSKDISLVQWWMKALLILPGFILMNYTLNLLLWQKRKVQYVLLCSILTLLSIGSVWLTVVISLGGILALFYCLVGSMGVSAIIGLIMVRKQVFTPLLPINKSLLKKLLWLGIPFSLAAFLQQLLPSIDRYFLIQYNYSHSLAVYVLAVKLGALMNFGISAFALAFTPYSMAKLNTEDAEKEISGLFRLVSVGTLLAIPLLLVFKDQLVLLFADASYQSSAKLLPFFFFGWAFDLFCFFSILGIYRSQKTFLQLILFLIAASIISIANLLLVPSFGLYGAAISFCFTKAAVFFISLVWFRKYFHLQVQPFSFLLVLLTSIGCSYSVYVLPALTNVFILGIVLLIAWFYFFRDLFVKKRSQFIG